MAEAQRQLHIRIPARLHRALRLRAAVEDKSIQELVVALLAKELAPDSLEDDALGESDGNDE